MEGGTTCRRARVYCQLVSGLWLEPPVTQIEAPAGLEAAAIAGKSLQKAGSAKIQLEGVAAQIFSSPNSQHPDHHALVLHSFYINHLCPVDILRLRIVKEKKTAERFYGRREVKAELVPSVLKAFSNSNAAAGRMQFC